MLKQASLLYGMVVTNFAIHHNVLCGTSTLPATIDDESIGAQKLCILLKSLLEVLLVVVEVALLH